MKFPHVRAGFGHAGQKLRPLPKFDMHAVGLVARDLEGMIRTFGAEIDASRMGFGRMERPSLTGAGATKLSASDDRLAVTTGDCG
jgi:hypothetical protein